LDTRIATPTLAAQLTEVSIMSTPRRVHYVLSSHWDREWYQSFQTFRQRLVQLLDRVLDGIESGRLQGPFTLDGQAIVVEDYLEVRPQNRARIEALIQEGKLIAGPWYDLPDEFLVSGESLIRNIQLGRKLVREWGAEPSNAGWVCDIFGHNSQLPQLLNLFGIRGGFLWRGTNDLTATRRWRGADGTELLCHRLGPTGYCTYAADVRLLGGDGPAPIGEAAQREAAERIETFLQAESERTPVGPLLVFDGADHQEWDEVTYRALMEKAAQPDGKWEIIHSTLDAYLEELAAVGENVTDILEGELREPGRDPEATEIQWVIAGVLSSRVNLKQENAHCQTLLTNLAEPLATVASSSLGVEYPADYLRVAWKWLLQNHPHDSICGCSIDVVHRDMLYRFSQTRQLGELLTSKAQAAITAAIEGELSENEIRVTVTNPLPRDIEEVAEITLKIPTDWPFFQEFFGFEKKPAFRLYDASGAEVAYQLLGLSEERSQLFADTIRFPKAWMAREVRVAIPVKIAGLGYTSLTVRSAKDEFPRHPAMPRMASAENTLENEFLRVEVQPNGSLKLTDKRNGEVYERLLTLEDCADIGDGWFHGMAVNDQKVVSTASTAEVAVLYDGPLSAAMRVRTHFRVPAEFDSKLGTRSEKWVELLADTRLVLRAGSTALEVETTINNVALDHRLRMLFPTGADTQTYLSDTPFDVVERPIALRSDNHLYRELEVETKPQTSWSALHDGNRGLAIINDGSLLECAALDVPERTLALTLFRATRRTVFTDGEPDGQMQGPLKFRFAIVPLQGQPDVTAIFDKAAQIAAGLPVWQLRSDDLTLARRELTNPAGRAETTPFRTLPAAAGFLRVEGAAVISAIQKTDEGIEVRLFNPTTSTIETGLVLDAVLCPKLPVTATKIDLDYRVLEELAAPENGAVRFTLRAKEIATIRLA
jgi:alpha-mannosidase